MADMPRYARADTFLSREEHLEFRGITTLLELLDSAEPFDRDLIITNDVTEDASDLYLKCLSRLFVRGDESVVVGRSGHYGVIAVGMDVGCGYRAMPGKVPQDPDIISSDTTFEPVSSTSEGQSDNIPLLSTTLPFFVESLKKHEWQPIERGHLPFPFSFELHCKNIVTMLQLVYNHYDDEDEQKRWYNKCALRDYVVLSSCTKIKRIFDEGFSQYGLWIGKCIEMDGTTQISEKHHRTLKKNFINRPASKVERSVLSAILNHLLQAGFLTEAKALELGWMSSENALSSCKPIYDRVGRAHFQTIMSMTFRYTKGCVEHLAVELEKNIPQQGRHFDIPDIPLREAVQTIKQATKAACSSLILWHCFLQAFDKIVDLHIDWLEQITQPNTSNIPYTHEPFVQKSFMQGDQINRPDNNIRAYFVAQHITSYTNNRPKAIFANKIEPTALHKQNSWGTAVKNYLHRIDEYISALMTLDPDLHKKEKDKLHRLVSRMDFRAFEFHKYPESGDAKMSSLGSIISRFAETNPEKFTHRNIQLIKDWLHDTLNARQAGNLARKKFNELLANTDFAGTCHVEAIPMALSMISTSRLPESYVDTRKLGIQLQTDEIQSLRVPERRVVDAFQGLRKRLMVSTPCCPACEIFSQELQEHDESSGILAHHQVWRAAALPPWTLKEKGRLVIEEAKKVLAKQLERVATLQNKIRVERLDDINKISVAVMRTRRKVIETCEDVMELQRLCESEKLRKAKEDMRSMQEPKILEAKVGILQKAPTEPMSSKIKRKATEVEEVSVASRKTQQPPTEPKSNKKQRRTVIKQEANIDEENMPKLALEPQINERKRETAEEGEAKVGAKTIKVENGNHQITTRSQSKRTGAKLYGEKRAANGDFLICG